MLAYFYIPRLSNDMKIAVQKNHLVAQILYRSLVGPTKLVQLWALLKKASILFYPNFL